ncbi:4-phosphoerythronate dehydrogenase [Thalassomonas viridans]|uniref:Erythronate-4-phosphate dehydrogenase n=1 Tax=Thalassomonas viridans TaxID=137584 RepID=A0AAE9Z1N3_9GAMM|nr:4-phosphoerythronate dehydrogenase [Thalassomonas viridans]WDE03578.1 4-phosphoerythronate dehydrogenase [Thalassomonas viridans]
MKIYYDENMPFAREFFSGLGELVPFAGRELSQETAAEADVLLVRSITRVNQALLQSNKQIQFVGTATIGVDHIDQAYLNSRNISFSAAPGCNAVSVAEYVLSALVVLAERYLLDLSGLTVGIVGAGNTGTRLSEKLKALGIRYYLCDPLLAEQGDEREFVSLERVLSCDVISLHVPLTTAGQYPSYHLLNRERLTRLTDKQILINACRGEVVDNQALLELKQAGHGLKLVWDVWENEPDILMPLIDHTEIATAHIAGYSLEGKARGTEMLYLALCKQLKIKPKLTLSQFLPPASITHVEIKQHFDEIILNQLVKMVYDVRRDDGIFRQQLSCQGFDMLRKNYPVRREFSAVTVALAEQASNNDVPHQLGFNFPR